MLTSTNQYPANPFKINEEYIGIHRTPMYRDHQQAKNRHLTSPTSKLNLRLWPYEGIWTQGWKQQHYPTIQKEYCKRLLLPLRYYAFTTLQRFMGRAAEPKPGQKPCNMFSNPTDVSALRYPAICSANYIVRVIELVKESIHRTKTIFHVRNMDSWLVESSSNDFNYETKSSSNSCS